MQRIINFLYIIFITALLTLFIGAKEIVVYENDFSKSDLLGCEETGNWQIADGVLKTESGSGSEKKKEHHEYHCQDRFHCFNSLHHLYELKIPINCVLLFTFLIILKNHFRQKGVQHDKI